MRGRWPLAAAVHARGAAGWLERNVERRAASVYGRRAVILKSIEEQGQLSPELAAQLEAAETLTELEDLYLPYRPKRQTRASQAREKGLEPLAEIILRQGKETPEGAAQPFVKDAVPSVEEALAGARDIIAERISDHAEVRGTLRARALRFASLQAEKAKDAQDEKGVYQTYYTFQNRVDRVQPYQTLAINRGEAEKILRVKVEVQPRDWQDAIYAHFRPHPRSPLQAQLQAAIEDAAQRLLLPAIERDVRSTLSEAAEAHAIQVFAANLRGLLTQPPLAERVVMGIDPAYRTGCKLAVVDATGKLLVTHTIYPHAPQNRRSEALRDLRRLLQAHAVQLIAIGNGTASRETEQLVAEVIREERDVHYLMVSEAGASVYSASPLARNELPDLDVSLRGAVSIARRAQDPLAELVKIDPKAIGVGMYQHDVNQKALAHALDGVVESVVNRVGVDVNTASPALLTYVAGIGPKLAEKIVAFRNAQGSFADRAMLRQVSGLGAKAFEQAAGFLRVRGGKNPLDASAIHPESYATARAVLKQARLSLESTPETREAALAPLRQPQALAHLAAELGTGVPTLSDILAQLVRPGRDPREDVPPPLLRSDVLAMEDLRPGMRLNGTVRNVVDFGSFIDIGVKQDGLLHRSQLPPGTQLSVGQVLEVEILNIELERGRIGLGWVNGHDTA
ncbi:MAG: RNA-binding transcriptional accessory protein [Deltaproteobacteria bacterium]|nr:RNA-binding transcriptional accessory protein [Deltaproteobacteria bacterium]